MTAIAHAISLQGVDGIPVAVEAHIASGIVSTTIVGLGDIALRESRERLRAALHSCQVPALNRRLTINLSPASLPKNGSAFDLSIAVAVLMSRGLLEASIARETVFAAELGLDGSLRPVEGNLALVWAAKKLGFTRIVVSVEGWREAREVRGIQVVPCGNLRHLLDAFGTRAQADAIGTGNDGLGWEHLETVMRALPERSGPDESSPVGVSPMADPDLAELRGQPEGRLALLIAAVGGHHLLLHGDPGSGKTLMAERLSSVLPPLSEEQAVEVAAIYSAAGLNWDHASRRSPTVILTPSATVASLLGGGKKIRPGAVSLANAGVLVLNEAPEFSPRLLDSLRQPLETGTVTIRRSATTLSFPARFQLVLTANPCPCGWEGTVRGCGCTPAQKRRYRQRLSGPLLDRIDIQQQVLQPHLADLESTLPLTSAAAREAVTEARRRSNNRWAENPWNLNSEVPGPFLRSYPGLPEPVKELLDRRVGQGWLSLRGADRILRLAWSIADLEGHSRPTGDDFGLALDLRTKTDWRAP